MTVEEHLRAAVEVAVAADWPFTKIAGVVMDAYEELTPGDTG